MMRLDPPIPLETEKGFGYAHFLFDYGLESSLLWGVALENGQFWQIPNEKIRFCKNYSAERPGPESATKTLSS